MNSRSPKMPQKLLTVALTRCDAVLLRLWVVALLHIAGLVLWWRSPQVGAPLVAGAVIAELGLGVWWLLMIQERRGACLGLIAEGRGALPLAALARERARLASPRHQAELARSIARLITRASNWDVTPTARAPTDPRVVSDAAPELSEIERQIEAGDISVRALALVEQLLCSPTSPLYGDDAGELKRELGRVRYLARGTGAPDSR